MTLGTNIAKKLKPLSKLLGEDKKDAFLTGAAASVTALGTAGILDQLLEKSC